MDTDSQPIEGSLQPTEAPAMSDTDLALSELFTLVEQLEAEPGNIPLLERHLAVARRCGPGMEEQVQRGIELLLEVKAGSEALWTEALEGVYAGIPEMTEERVPAVFSLLAKAASDYCCIPVLSLVARVLAVISGHPEVVDPDAMDTTSGAEQGGSVSTSLRVEEYQAREVWKQAVQMADYDITQSHAVWNQYRTWEMRILEASAEGAQERVLQLKRMHQVWIDRLATPHANSSETSSAYSTFNSTFAPEAYESHMVTATKASSKPAAKYAAREAYEAGYAALPPVSAHVSSVTAPEVQQRLAYLYAYLEMELAQGEKKADWKMVQCVYERMVALLGALETQAGDAKAVEARIWEKYGNYMAQANGPSKVQKGEIWTRAVRACPGSGDLWAKLLRVQEAADQPPEVIGETYVRALSLGEVTRPAAVQQGSKKGKAKEQAGKVPGATSVAELVKLERAWVGYLRRQEEASDEGMEGDDEAESALESALRAGIAQCKAVDPAGDPEFKLETYLISWLRRKGRTDEAAGLWEDIVKTNGKSHRLWLSYTDFEIQRLNYPKARTAFKNAVNKALDWPEAVWEAWIQFEDFYGTVESLETAKTRIAYLEEARQKKQMKEYQQQQAQAAARPSEPQASAAAEAPAVTEDPNARIDQLASAPAEDSKKRKSEAEPVTTADAEPANKKVRTEEPGPVAETPKDASGLKRDREHSTVFVSGLAPGTSESAVRKRFSDCGAIREIALTSKGDNLLATVEFMDRGSVLAALTKDKKTIDEAQIDVYVAWQSTLFVTNFPETADDQSMRELFLPYGEILDTRWPAKKFKNSRRFLYLQYQSPDSAVAALELHGRELQPGMPLSVLISDPERKKERTDAHADDREVYVTQLSRFAAEKDLQRLFSPCGSIKRVNVALDDQGHCKGFAFVEFEDESSVEAALVLNGTELKKRKMSVQKSQKQKGGPKRSDGSTPDHRSLGNSDGLSRSIRLKNLPPKTSEGLLQQALGKVTNVKVLQVFEIFHEATAELASASDVGALLLRSEPFVFNGAEIAISAETDPERSNLSGRIVRPAMAPRPAAAAGAPPRPATSFVPRPPKGAAKKRLALTTPTTTRKLGTGVTASAPSANGSTSQAAAKVQDDFRKMLLEGKKTE